MGVFTYPQFQATIVGLADDKMKWLHPHDMRALVEAFKQLTGFDPLAEGVKPHQAWVLFQQGRDPCNLAASLPEMTAAPSNVS